MGSGLRGALAIAQIPAPRGSPIGPADCNGYSSKGGAVGGGCSGWG